MKLSQTLSCAIVAISFAASMLDAQTSGPATQPNKAALTTYSNPISLPDYPIGKRSRDIVPGAPVNANEFLWLLGRREQYRELADVTVLWHDGKWYMYPSVDMAWVSSDGGITWQHHPLNVRDIGYAPTIVKHKGKFLLMAIDSAIYTSDSPLGPFTSIGKIAMPASVRSQIDPMLFSDEDGRLFYYWGNVFGIELDSENPTRVIGDPVRLLQFEPEKYPWQRCGDWNEDINAGYLEAAWVIKRNGTYYLTYCAGGTEFSTYAVGCLTSKSPLGPFTHQKNNPIQRSTTGLVTGTAHGSFAEGPNGSLWSFYTLRAGVVHGWERRLGMDPAWFDESGELHVAPASSIPMRMTGTNKGAEPAGWIPLNQNRQSTASTTAVNLTTRLAFDDDLRTWWQPDSGDKTPTLTSLLVGNSTVQAIRIAWRDIGINTRQGVVPGPYRYTVELQTGGNAWTKVIDRSASSEDLLIDYREIAPTRATAARLTIVGAPAGITPGVAEFTVFGQAAKR